MVSKRKPYNIYTREFKLEAIRLMSESDRPASQIVVVGDCDIIESFLFI